MDDDLKLGRMFYAPPTPSWMLDLAASVDAITDAPDREPLNPKGWREIPK